MRNINEEVLYKIYKINNWTKDDSPSESEY